MATVLFRRRFLRLRRSSPCVSAAIAIGLFLPAVLALAGCQIPLDVSRVTTTTRVTSTTTSPHGAAGKLYKVAEAYARAFHDGNGKKIYFLLTARARQTTSAARISKALLSRYSGVQSVYEFEVSERMRIDKDSAVVLIKFTMQSGWEKVHRTRWEKEKGQWRLSAGFPR